MLADALDRRIGEIQVIERRRLGDLEDQPMGQAGITGDHVHQGRHEGRLHQRPRRDVRRQLQLARALGVELRHHLFDDGEVQALDQFELLGHADGVERALIGLQADQSLEMLELAGEDLDDRLVDQLEPALVNRRGEGAGLVDRVLKHGVEGGAGVGGPVTQEAAQGEAEGAHGVERGRVGRQSQRLGSGVDVGAGGGGRPFQPARQMIGVVSPVPHEGVLLVAKLGRALAAEGLRAHGGGDAALHHIDAGVFEAHGGLHQPLHLDQFQIEVQAGGLGPVQQLASGGDEALRAVQIVGAVGNAEVGLGEDRPQGEHAGDVGCALRQSAGAEGGETPQSAHRIGAQFHPDGPATVGRAQALDDGGDQVVIGFGDDVRPGTAHGLGLVHAEHALRRAHDEDDPSLGIDLEQQVGARESKPQVSRGIVWHGDLRLQC